VRDLDIRCVASIPLSTGKRLMGLSIGHQRNVLKYLEAHAK